MTQASPADCLRQAAALNIPRQVSLEFFDSVKSQLEKFTARDWDRVRQDIVNNNTEFDLFGVLGLGNDFSGQWSAWDRGKQQAFVRLVEQQAHYARINVRGIDPTLIAAIEVCVNATNRATPQPITVVSETVGESVTIRVVLAFEMGMGVSVTGVASALLLLSPSQALPVELAAGRARSFLMTWNREPARTQVVVETNIGSFSVVVEPPIAASAGRLSYETPSNAVEPVGTHTTSPVESYNCHNLDVLTWALRGGPQPSFGQLIPNDRLMLHRFTINYQAPDGLRITSARGVNLGPFGSWEDIRAASISESHRDASVTIDAWSHPRRYAMEVTLERPTVVFSTNRREVPWDSRTHKYVFTLPKSARAPEFACVIKGTLVSLLLTDIEDGSTQKGIKVKVKKLQQELEFVLEVVDVWNLADGRVAPIT